jgi:hypothetical protein
MVLGAARAADSVMDILRRLGIKETGGSHQHIKRRLISLGFDTKNLALKGRASNLGKTFPHKRRSKESLLIKRSKGRRQFAHYLRRAMIEYGILHKCKTCACDPIWMGKKLVLQVDHINNDWLDDRLENLQFLCPNCHSIK